MTLHEIGLKHKTDKATTHLYMDNYEKHFYSWRDKEFTLLEIGVADKASINTWKEYFINANIWGIDNNPDCYGEGILIGSQIDTAFLDNVITFIGMPDIIIDDASHYGPNTIKTFEYLFPKLAAGGLYIVEDAHCFYDTTYGEAPPFGQGMSEVFKFFSSLACDVDIQGRGMTGNRDYALQVENPNFAPIPKYSPILKAMHVYPSLWIFEKT